MAKEKSKTLAFKTVSASEGKTSFALGKENYILMIIGVIVVAMGMLLMTGGASNDPNKMSEEIFNFRRLTLAPIVIVAGYLIVLFSIFKRNKENKEAN
jgi:cytochrome bd-type quinol oxidase subunit 2